MSVSAGANGTQDTDNESVLSISFSESETSDSAISKPKRNSPFEAIKTHATGRRPCSDCMRYCNMSYTEAQSLKTLIVTHLQTAHRVKVRPSRSTQNIIPQTNIQPPPPPPVKTLPPPATAPTLPQIKLPPPPPTQFKQPPPPPPLPVNQGASGSKTEAQKRPRENDPNAINPAKFSKFFANVPTHNRFETLQTEDEPTPTITTDAEIEDVTQTQQESIEKTAQDIRKKAKETLPQTTTNKTKTKNIKPPPIVMAGTITNNTKFKQLREALDAVTENLYQIKFTKRNTLIQTTDFNDFDSIKQSLAGDNEAQWHTYAAKDDKTHAFVLRGLDNDPDPGDILDELKNVNLPIKKVFRMKTQFKPLFLVVTDAQTTLKTLSKIKYISNVAVQWERRYNERGIIQCRRCYMWGHGQTNCHRAQRCPNCSQNHQGKDCTVTTPKCVNCGQAHKATDTNCPVYIFKQEKNTRKTDNLQRRTATHREPVAKKKCQGKWHRRGQGK